MNVYKNSVSAFPFSCVLGATGRSVLCALLIACMAAGVARGEVKVVTGINGMSAYDVVDASGAPIDWPAQNTSKVASFKCRKGNAVFSVKVEPAMPTVMVASATNLALAVKKDTKITVTSVDNVEIAEMELDFSNNGIATVTMTDPEEGTFSKTSEADIFQYKFEERTHRAVLNFKGNAQLEEIFVRGYYQEMVAPAPTPYANKNNDFWWGFPGYDIPEASVYFTYALEANLQFDAVGKVKLSSVKDPDPADCQAAPLNGEYRENVTYLWPVDGLHFSTAALLKTCATAEGYSPSGIGYLYNRSGDTGVGLLPEDGEVEAPVYYDVTGRRVLNPASGLYIEQRGKYVRKVLITK